MDQVEVALLLQELDEQSGIVTGEKFQLLVSFLDIRGTPPADFFPQSVFSGYTDITFESRFLSVDSIEYNDTFFSVAQTGSIDNASGLVDEVGAVANSFTALAADAVGPIFTLNLTALAEGTTTIATDVSEDVLSAITLFGEDDDLRGVAKLNELTLEITAEGGDSTRRNEIFFDYEQFLRFQDSNDTVPTDTINGLPLAQLFDERYYLRQNPDVDGAVQSGFFDSGYQHFINSGIAEGRNPSVLYNETFYRNNNVDVEAAINGGAVSSGLQHFLLYGHQEGRDPSQVFDQSDYLVNNPDVDAALSAGFLLSAFEHYILFGVDEERPPVASLYSETFYLQNNPEVADAVNAFSFDSGFEHFISFGQREGRPPSELFNEADYLALNADVNAAVIATELSNGFQHYEQFGRFEGRQAIAG